MYVYTYIYNYNKLIYTYIIIHTYIYPCLYSISVGFLLTVTLGTDPTRRWLVVHWIVSAKRTSRI